MDIAQRWLFLACPGQWFAAYLVLGVGVEEQDVDGLELLDVSVTLKLLSHLGSDGGNGHGERVHLLNLGGLSEWSDF